MNWIILIVAGFFESGFAFCLGKMKEVSGPNGIFGVPVSSSALRSA